MGRLVLHIGMHKTGTSSIQRFFSRNRRLLGLLGISYPVVRGPNGRWLSKQTDLFEAISHEKDFGSPHPFFGGSAGVVARLNTRIADTDVTVISAEGLSGEFPDFAIKCKALQASSVRVVVSLRPQADWVQSFYRQMVLSRDVAERRVFPAFLDDPDTRAHLDYEALLDRWAEAFGADNLRVLQYPPKQALLSGFLQAADLDTRLRWLPYGRAHANRSNSPDEVSALVDGPVGFGSAEERAAFQAQFDAAASRIAARFRSVRNA